MKEKSINKIIGLKIYPYDIMLSFNESDEKLKKRCDKLNVDISNHLEYGNPKRKSGKYVMFPGKQSVIRLNFIPHLKNPVEMSLLQHEIFHAVHFILDETGMPLKEDSCEAYAYLCQYLTKRIYRLL